MRSASSAYSTGSGCGAVIYFATVAVMLAGGAATVPRPRCGLHFVLVWGWALNPSTQCRAACRSGVVDRLVRQPPRHLHAAGNAGRRRTGRWRHRPAHGLRQHAPRLVCSAGHAAFDRSPACARARTRFLRPRGARPAHRGLVSRSVQVQQAHPSAGSTLGLRRSPSCSCWSMA